MADTADDLIDYEEEEETTQVEIANGHPQEKEVKKGSYVGIHSTGFRDFLLKPELLRSIVDCGFEHPSEVQQECIPQAILGMDVLCQAKSGMGKTAVFVLASLQQIEARANEVVVVVLCHTRELAFQIKNEYARFSKYMPETKTAGLSSNLTLLNLFRCRVKFSTVAPVSSKITKHSSPTALTLSSAHPAVFWP